MMTEVSLSVIHPPLHVVGPQACNLFCCSDLCNDAAFVLDLRLLDVNARVSACLACVGHVHFFARPWFPSITGVTTRQQIPEFIYNGSRDVLAGSRGSPQ